MKAKLKEFFLDCTQSHIIRSIACTKDYPDVMSDEVFREKRLALLLELCTPQESVIPPPKWRKRYGSYCSIGPEGAEALCKLLLDQRNKAGDEPTMEGRRTLTLNLRGLRIGDRGMRALATLIASDDRLVSLFLSNNNITDDGATLLVSALSESFPSLRQLSLLNNPLTMVGVQRVLNFCATSSMSLTELGLCRGARGKEPKCLHDIDPYSEGLKDGILELLDSCDGTTLTSLTYSGCDCADFSPGALGSVFRTAMCESKLRHLALVDCYTTVPCDDAKCLPGKALVAPLWVAARALSSTSATLRSLELQIPLSDAAVTALADGIRGATLLFKLCLRRCDMSAKGLSIIGDALATNRTLLGLDLSYQSAEVKHPFCGRSWDNDMIFGRVKTNTHQSCHPLLDVFRALQHNKTLQELLVLGIDITPSDVDDLCAFLNLGNNRTLRRVRHENVCCEVLDWRLEVILQRNRTSPPSLPQSSESFEKQGKATRSSLPAHDDVAGQNPQTRMGGLSPRASALRGRGASGDVQAAGGRGAFSPSPHPPSEAAAGGGRDTSRLASGMATSMRGARSKSRAMTVM